MANLTVSEVVDTFMQASTATEARTAIGAIGSIPTAFTVVVVSTDTLTINNANHDTYEGKVVRFTHADGCAVELANDLPAGWNMLAEQTDDDEVVFSPASGATLNHRQGHDRTAGQYAVVSLYCATNSGTDAVLVLGGDTAEAP